MVAHEWGVFDSFDKSYIKDGFCVANQDKSVYVQSHALCFYADTAYSIVLWIMAKACVSNMPEASYDFIKVNTMGVFAHGCGHLLLVFKPVGN